MKNLAAWISLSGEQTTGKHVKFWQCFSHKVSPDKGPLQLI